jgi:hypothetical protein
MIERVARPGLTYNVEFALALYITKYELCSGFKKNVKFGVSLLL